MQKITPFLWFDDKAEEAMNFYTSIFKNSNIVSVTRYGEGGPGPKGTVMTAVFQLEGQEFSRSTAARYSPSRRPYRFS
jgi:predicted 3-demethylubiquinone-9 3-methyltransferase (glyoxalase superfamily)